MTNALPVSAEGETKVCGRTWYRTSYTLSVYIKMFFSDTFASGSEKYVIEWLLPFLERNYGADHKKMKPHGFVIIDMPMEYNTSEYSQTIIGPEGSEAEVMILRNNRDLTVEILSLIFKLHHFWKAQTTPIYSRTSVARTPLGP